MRVGLPLVLVSAAAVAELPPFACVEALRRARIEELEGRVTEARRQLTAAIDLAGCEIPALAELLYRLRGEPELESEGERLRVRLVGRIEDAAVALPSGTLLYLASLPAPEVENEALLAALVRRLAKIDAGEGKADRGTLLEIVSVAADLAERTSDWERARTLVGRLALLGDAEAARWRALAIDKRLERWNDVARLLEEMLALPGAPIFVRTEYVRALARLGRYQELLAEIERIVPAATTTEENGLLASILVESAWLLRDAGSDPESEQLFRRALALHPEHEEARAALLHLYGSGEERAAHEAAVAARRASEESPFALFDEGARLLATGDFATALELLERAAPGLAGTPAEEPAWYNLGLAAYRLERWGRAAEAFARAAELNPDRPETQFQLGVALFKLERLREAIAPFRRTLELDSAKYQAHYYLGSCYEAVGDTAAAQREKTLYRERKPASN